MRFTIILLLTTLLVSCSTTKEMTSIDPKAKNEIELLTTKINIIKNRGYYLMSPSEFSKAQEKLEDAEQSAKSGEPLDKVLDDIASSHSHIENVNENIKLAKFHIQGIIDAREEAIREGAGSFDSFKSAEEEFVAIGQSLERNDINDVLENREDVEKMYVLSEIEAIQNRELLVVNKNLDLINKLDGDDLYEEKMELLIQDKESAKKLISSFKDTPSRYMPAVDKANFSSQSLLTLTQTASWIEKSESSEVALKIHEDLTDIAQTLDRSDTSSKNYENQISHIKKEVSYIPGLVSSLSKKQMDLYEKNRKLNKAIISNHHLEKKIDKQMHIKKKVEFVQNLFSRDEAKVLVQGNDLIIRLVGLNFAFDKASLPENSDRLLNKVAKSISVFDASDIKIQGHSDSVGNALYNEELSKKRAIAVNEFLVSNSEIDNSVTTVQGFGFRKPLVHNKSQNSKMKNRRIDVVINSITQ